jgi:hypothetical protein
VLVGVANESYGVCLSGQADRTAAPVVNGKVEVQIVGKHAGQIHLRFRLIVKNPQFAAQI